MKRILLLTVGFLFIVVSNVSGADLTGCWYGEMVCPFNPAYPNSGDGPQTIKLEQFDDDTFIVVNEDEGGEFCGGVVDGKNFYMSCDGRPNSQPSFAYGEVKGNTLSVINHVPTDGKACKGIYTRIPCP